MQELAFLGILLVLIGQIGALVHLYEEIRTGQRVSRLKLLLQEIESWETKPKS